MANLEKKVQVQVTIHDDQVVEFLQECVRVSCFGGDFPATHPHHLENIAHILEVCSAMNRTIEYLGGSKMDVHKLIAESIR